MGLEPADETLGRYRLFARLGRGGMAELHVAQMTGAAGVAKLVVIKRMLGHLADDAQFVQMFENEGRIAVRLDHPNVCQTYELDNINGQLFLVMELVRGMPWSTVVTRLPPDELAACRFIVGVMTQACEGLHYAHHLTDALGNVTPVVHRDMTPGNLMITNDGAIKLLDFGVSKLLNDEHATRAGMIKGKLPYMAPEHIRGELVDPRADLFSLGVVMWEALARRSLFERPSDLQIFKAIVEDDVPRLPRTPITQRLEVVLRRALARNRNDRQASARQLADELREALAPEMPMTQAQIQAAMSDWLHDEMVQAHQDLAGAINRLRSVASLEADTEQDEGRTSIDMVIGRAAETRVGALPDAEADTEYGPLPVLRFPVRPESEPSIIAKSPPPAPPRPPVRFPVRPESEPSLTSNAPTARRAVVKPLFEEQSEESTSMSTAPRALPLQLPAPPDEQLGTTQPFIALTASSRPVLRQAAPAPSSDARIWIVVMALISVAIGVFVALVSS